LANLPIVLSVLTKADPLSYGIDGLRAALINGGQFGIPLDAGFLTVAALVLLSLGAWSFSKIEI